jgi:hypothetical protein
MNMLEDQGHIGNWLTFFNVAPQLGMAAVGITTPVVITPGLLPSMRQGSNEIFSQRERPTQVGLRRPGQRVLMRRKDRMVA